jgi:hypothetical protein
VLHRKIPLVASCKVDAIQIDPAMSPMARYIVDLSVSEHINAHLVLMVVETEDHTLVGAAASR